MRERQTVWSLDGDVLEEAPRVRMPVDGRSVALTTLTVLWGMLLAVPILMVIRTVSDRVAGLKPIAELLSD